MKIAIGQLNPTIGAFLKNERRILEMVEEAIQSNADLIVFPEMALCGYPPEDLLLLDDFIDEVEKTVQRIAPVSTKIAILLGLPRRNIDNGEKKLFNAAALLQEGKIVQYFDKRLLPTYDLFDEKRYFEPGHSPFCFTLKGKKIAVTICEDIWEETSESKYSEKPLEEIASLKPDLLINISASPYHFGKGKIRSNVVIRAAKKVGAPTLLVNQVGGMDSLIFDGRSLFVDNLGKILHRSKPFHETLEYIDLAKNIKEAPPPPEELEALYQALILGIRDYFHKQGFQKACLGLSGGIDSALVLVLAQAALGHENLLAVLMPSPFSSKGSIEDAMALASTLGVKTTQIPIDDSYYLFLKMLAPTFGNRPLDVTEENIQARIRGLLLMAISNKEGSILLSTGNKSEMAMGYSTLYGDLTGGLAVISDLSKEKVYALAHHINSKKPLIPASILTKEPSAELRPNQKDSDSLPPYPIIDKVLEGYVERNLSEKAIIAEYKLDPSIVHQILQKIHQSEYKRRQAPPGLRVTEKAFSIGRKFPIVQRWR